MEEKGCIGYNWLFHLSRETERERERCALKMSVDVDKLCVARWAEILIHREQVQCEMEIMQCV